MRKITLSIILTLLLSACGTIGFSSDEKINGTLSEEQKSEVAMFSFGLLETKYNWGGKKPNFGLDCSGLVSYVYKKSINKNLYGAARDIVKHGKDVPLEHARKNMLQAGDLLFFNTTGKPYSHVGIYVGNKSFLHASSGRGKVIISPVNNKYYISRLERIKRL